MLPVFISKGRAKKKPVTRYNVADDTVVNHICLELNIYCMCVNVTVNAMGRTVREVYV